MCVNQMPEKGSRERCDIRKKRENQGYYAPYLITFERITYKHYIFITKEGRGKDKLHIK